MNLKIFQTNLKISVLEALDSLSKINFRIYLQKVKSNLKRILPNFKTPLIITSIILGLFLLTYSLQVITISFANYFVVTKSPAIDVTAIQIDLEKDIIKLDKKLNAKIPKTPYLIINSTENDFYLFKGDKLIHKDKCSTGSYILLKNGNEQQWMFKTPKGEFRILGKTTSPVWKKPDWAFVEEGLSVPSANHHSRYEYGVLGDYALNLGNGYLIHGTLYQRFIGLPVTHGCIRLNDKNLELVYKSLNMGSKVYIY